MMKKNILWIFGLLIIASNVRGQDMTQMWDSQIKKSDDKSQWFQDAKFGLFIHWGLFSDLNGQYDGKNYYGISEWIQNRAQVPAAEYAHLAKKFNPVKFDPKEWVKFAKNAGIKYMVVTSKHHDGFAMFDSKISDFNIVKATPYGKDPMKPLSEECRKAGIQFGFYYSQYQDWHEPKGGGSRWEFKNKGPLEEYYKEKAIPQIKELMSNYGQLGMIWFDTPGGQSKEETKAMVDELHKLQPNCLFSSRVGNGMGDYRDFGDGEIPETIIEGKWESIFTHNDSWGYTPTDQNYKTSKELIHILAEVASKGGNLMVNIGPDAQGTIPYYSIKYFTEVGEWLKKNGDAIYGTTYGEVPAQIWGVTTAKPQKLFLHVLESPENGQLLVPGFNAKVKAVKCMDGNKSIKYSQKGSDLYVSLPKKLADNKNTVFMVQYEGELQNGYKGNSPAIISSHYENCKISPMKAIRFGQTKAGNETNSNYFGDWRHIPCLSNMHTTNDKAVFNLRFIGPGDYRIQLEYSCIQDNAGQEGKIVINNKSYLFQTLEAQTKYDIWKPMLFVKHTIGIIHIDSAGEYPLVIQPFKDGKELFKLKSLNFEFID